MSNYVLVHGGSVDKSVWDKVVPYLEEMGHKVFALTLSDERTSSLTNHILEVCKLIEGEGIDDVILVGHSYGGLVITGVADRTHEKIHHLIYVDTLIPMNGKSLFDYFEFYNVGKDIVAGLDPFPPFIEPLYFDEKEIKKIPKTHIRCKQSEFIEISRKSCKDLDAKAKEDNWETFELDTVHNCMLTQPKEVAEILLKIR
ncbi:MAG: alpha/beta hydrolase [Euryarchaeota archaeon]|nr:alpha/beta hydrolase [Euryarchaeota archaeon]